MAEEKRKVTVERADLFSVPDYVFEELLGLPAPSTVVKTVFPPPKRVFELMGVPTPVDLFEEARRKVEERAKAAVRK